MQTGQGAPGASHYRCSIALSGTRHLRLIDIDAQLLQGRKGLVALRYLGLVRLQGRIECAEIPVELLQIRWCCGEQILRSKGAHAAVEMIDRFLVQSGELGNIDLGPEAVDDVVTKQRPIVRHILIMFLDQDHGSDLDQPELAGIDGLQGR